MTSPAETEVYRPSAAINPERLDYLWTLAERIAKSSMVPESLRTTGPANNKVDLPQDQVVANVFAVCEQADRWNQSPFALLSCSAMVHGKLGFEGKVIAAVLEANFGIALRHYFTGNPTEESCRIYLCDRNLPDDIVAQLSPSIRVPGFNIMDGDVATWKTSGNGSPWRPATYTKMLVYRGTREWCRIYKPAAIMGILSDDELLEIDIDRRARGARDISSPASNPLLDHSPAMPMDRFDAETGELIPSSEAPSPMRTPARASGDSDRRSVASGKPAPRAGRETGSALDSQSPTQSSSSSPSSRGDDESSTRSSSQGGDSSAGGENPRFPSGIFDQYSAALLRFSSAENIEKAHEEFWSKSELGKPTHPADLNLGKSIKGMHIARVKGELQIGDLKGKIENAIKSSFEGL